MHKFLTTTWLALALIPYLFFAMLESFPHRHGERGGMTCACCQCCDSAWTGYQTGMVLADANAAPCPLCQMQMALTTCAHLSVSTCAPLHFGAADLVVTATSSASQLITYHSSRAPPASLG